MPRTREQLRNNVKANLNIRPDDNFAGLINDDGTPNAVTTNTQLDKYLDEGKDLACRNVLLIPARGTIATVVGQDTYRLADFAAVRSEDSTSVGSGDGTRLWTAVKEFGGVTYNNVPLRYSSRQSARAWQLAGVIQTNGTPEYFYYADDKGELIGLDKPAAASQQIKVKGYGVPPSISSGAMAFDFLPDDEYGGIESYATARIAMQAQEQLEYAADIIRIHSLNWNTWATNRYATVPDWMKLEYKMVLPLLPVGGGN